MSYDPRCHVLAKQFLAEQPAEYKTAENVNALAGRIQKAVDEFLDSLNDSKD